MDARLERVAPRRVGEDDVRDAAAIHRPVGPEDRVAEELAGRGLTGSTVRVQLAHDLIGVEDVRAELAQHRGDGGFSGCEASGQPDAQHSVMAPAI